MTPTEALARIAALIDNSDRTGWDIETEQVRAVLAEVTPETAGVLLDVIETRIAHGWYLDVALRQKVSAEETALADRLRKAI